MLDSIKVDSDPIPLIVKRQGGEEISECWKDWANNGLERLEKEMLEIKILSNLKISLEMQLCVSDQMANQLFTKFLHCNGLEMAWNQTTLPNSHDLMRY